ncbi:MAG: hypothetical protein CMC36_03085 [Flavobacteriaceae bacterium]|nr:hypothetical protein [Flavobacteriaceae bacterium]|tara:strand:- start:311 stop:1489 length:1179 start_codon:yes stop_codon:yes gene_type:complete
MRKVLFLLFFIFISQLNAQSVYVEDRKIYVDGQEYRVNGICYARGEGNGENSGYSFNDDIPLLVDANINTIRTYAAITNAAELNAFANAGIKVIMMLNENSYTWYVNQFKDHPAILMWEFGNEFNYHPEWFGNNIQNWYNILEDRASTVKALDPDHPVSTGHGEVPDSQALNSCPSVDVWGMNIYRWLSPDSAIDELAAMTDKAMYISEAGADSFNINSNSENQDQQAQATEIILNAIIDKSDICIGVTLFEFCDEWWKAGNPNQQDQGGFPNAIPYDNFANEEYWGIVTRDREPKLSYYVVQEIYEATSLSLNDNFLDINIYPNPVSDGFLNIVSNSNNPLIIYIYDLNGREVMSQKIIFDSINISNLSQGIYSLKLSDGKKYTVKKIVVK